MSSWKRAAKMGQKTHRERHQPEARKHLGLLEKKKDYVLRAKDYQDKQAALKLLRSKALNKNPDEFYFHMLNSKLDDGVHREKEKDEEHTPEQLNLMETRDHRYLSYKRNIEAKKIEKLQSQLHMINHANEISNRHTFFVDDGEEAKNFDIAKRLNTHEAFVGRVNNRPRLDDLKKMKPLKIEERSIGKVEQQRHMAYTELYKRVDRERELSIVQRKMEIERALDNKTATRPIKIRPGSKDSAPIYQWKFERKR